LACHPCIEDSPLRAGTVKFGIWNLEVRIRYECQIPRSTFQIQGTRRTARTAFSPPKAKEFEIAARTVIGRETLGT
jgi:hypothetical protein